MPSTHWTFPLKLLYSIGISCVFVAPALVGYALKIQVTRQSFWVLGVYGLVVFCFIGLQLSFATVNRIMAHRYSNRLAKAISNSDLTTEKFEVSEKPTEVMEEGQQIRSCTKMGLAVVGYREEPGLFSQCLESIKSLKYPEPFKIIAVIDGDDKDDQEMAAVFQKVFPKCPVVVLPELLSFSFQRLKSEESTRASVAGSSSTESDTIKEKPDVLLDYDRIIKDQLTLPTDTQAVCYLQPHRGKRHAMYTAFRVLMAAGCEAIMSTDSDTRFDPQAMIEMEKALHWFPNIGAAAGDVRILNSKDSLLSYMSSLRYWMAFNIERAAQSFNRCVTCVSGPMGIYRSDVLKQILDVWIEQSFLGMECTYGDDRHLTNLTLLKGYRVVYTHLAFCETETPTAFLRWFKQQTRWSKSFYRELLWNARSLHKHSPWMAAELFYQGIYPFVLLFSIFQILFSKTPFILVVWLISLGAIACIKTIYSTVVALSLRFLGFPVYSLYYLFGLVPSKLWALISLWDVGWGTSARSASEMKRENVFCSKLKEALPILFWSLLLLSGVTFNIVMYFLDPNHPTGADFFGLDTGIDPTSIVFYPNPNNHKF
ncbi:nucleotide-diphospho-sugar transferase [Sporodiniella umbellata]|nr:nucleotide-diphospho-sugar transferase [Sporodiniella umbellata]